MEEAMHNTLLQHGFKRVKKGIAGGGHTYQRGHHTVNVARANGKVLGWNAHIKHVPGKSEGAHIPGGKDHASLIAHLSASQHSESNPDQPETDEQFWEKVRVGLNEGMEQFGEASLMAGARKYGYKPFKTNAGEHGGYAHAETGHTLHISKTGSDTWTHHRNGAKTTGVGASSMEAHLASIHGHQHSETEETPDWEALVAVGPIGTQAWNR